MINRLILAIALTAAMSCGTVGKVIWPATVTCGAPLAGALLDEIKRIVSEGGAGWETALEKLAAENGPELVACILGQLIDNWLPGNGNLASPHDAAAAGRAQSFLNGHEVTVRDQ